MAHILAAIRRLGRAFPLALPLALAAVPVARAAVVAEGTYSITAPERRVIPFRMVLTPTGARIVPGQGETMVFSYETKSAIVLDAGSRSYFLLPMDLVPALLAAGLGYDPSGLGATSSGTTRRLLGTSCEDVVVRGRASRVTLQSCRVADPGWSRDYAKLESALGLPWATASPPPVFVGLPLTGSVSIDGERPYRASWEITKIAQDASASENFAVPQGYRMDLERLLSLQRRR